jgi:hypothetical protein
MTENMTRYKSPLIKICVTYITVECNIQHAFLHSHEFWAASLSRQRCTSNCSRRNMDCSQSDQNPSQKLILTSMADQHRSAHTSSRRRHSQSRRKVVLVRASFSMHHQHFLTCSGLAKTRPTALLSSTSTATHPRIW